TIAPAAADPTPGVGPLVPKWYINATVDHPRMREHPSPHPERSLVGTLVCGRGEGSHVELLTCGDPTADLTGSATARSGRGPRKDCSRVTGWFSYSHGAGYNICWFFSSTDPPRAWARTISSDPFTVQERRRLRL